MADERALTAAANAAALQRTIGIALGMPVLDAGEFVAVDGGARRRRNRVVLTTPMDDPRPLVERLREFYGERPYGAGIQIEESFDRLDLGPYGFHRAWEMPVMHREGKRTEWPDGPVEVGRVRDEEGLAEAERVIIEGFPYPDLSPVRAGLLAHPALLTVPGMTFWLGTFDLTPITACATLTTEESVGIYQMATLATQRGKGGARAVLNAILSAGRPAVLTATDKGGPIYESFGFVAVGPSCWWRLADRQRLLRA